MLFFIYMIYCHTFSHLLLQGLLFLAFLYDYLINLVELNEVFSSLSLPTTLLSI